MARGVVARAVRGLQPSCGKRVHLLVLAPVVVSQVALRRRCGSRRNDTGRSPPLPSVEVGSQGRVSKNLECVELSLSGVVDAEVVGGEREEPMALVVFLDANKLASEWLG